MKVLVHYHEIALKGKNRPFFEQQLMKNIIAASRKENIAVSCKRDYGRILCETNAEKGIVQDVLSCVFGIQSFAFIEETSSTLSAVVQKAATFLKNVDRSLTLKFETKRADKQLPFTSVDVNKELGAQAIALGFSLNLKHPDFVLYAELTSKKAYLYSEKILGLGGLPVGCTGKVLVLFSGGIDSAVAAWLMMKRGCQVDFLHFHTFKENKEVLDTKIMALKNRLDLFQESSRLFLVPYHTYELATLGKIPERYNLVLFKHFLLKFAEFLALQKKYLALVTGDSLAQVASQTLENIRSSSYGISLPLFRPLLTYDKQEIIDLAERIGTYKTSIKEYKDCCSIVSKNPATKVSLEKFKKILEDVSVDSLLKDIASNLSCV